MRGNHLGQALLSGRGGSIPTHAGKPEPIRNDQDRKKVYPHACGETLRSRCLRTARKGLSPRMRGNPLRHCSKQIIPRSIPTHAGKPLGHNDAPPERWVYPHACGETTPAGLKSAWTQGLSPRMRGNRSMPAAAARSRRSIPTHAGKPDSGPAAARV